MIKNFHHIALAVKSIHKAKSFYSDLLGISASNIINISEADINIACFNVSKGFILELIEGTSEDSDISRFIEMSGEGLHHMAFEVEDIYYTIRKLKEKNIEFLNEKPQEGIDGLIVFIKPEYCNDVLIELVQKL